MVKGLVLTRSPVGEGEARTHGARGRIFGQNLLEGCEVWRWSGRLMSMPALTLAAPQVCEGHS